ncbi:hypothetical protein A1355_22140 [Methylomonas koyamae]|uniref:Uncharacterized protein n=1 Tax=Methylomonas koyamae TaxID=702114 RepID=A0A177P0N3_9GAMM|nr:hypothetical protein A1355_22140 [Methylomonas koyamae]
MGLAEAGLGFFLAGSATKVAALWPMCLADADRRRLTSCVGKVDTATFVAGASERFNSRGVGAVPIQANHHSPHPEKSAERQS